MGAAAAMPGVRPRHELVHAGGHPGDDPGERGRLAGTARRPDATRRPRPDKWSPLEYGCHVRDVLKLYDYRLGLMLTEDDPLYPNWDQDETAIADRYDTQDPATVADELAAAAEAIADRFGTLSAAQWERPGRRSDGAAFTVETFGRYFVHDPVHHLHDVTGRRPA